MASMLSAFFSMAFMASIEHIYSLHQQEIEACVAVHNQLRALHKNTPPLEWDESIAAKAQQYAEKLLAMNQGRSRTLLKHDTNKNGLGENLYWEDNNAPSTCPVATLAWYNEIDDYDYSTAKSKNGKPVGHFTQVVWKDTLKFGVGIAVGKSRIYPEYGNVETFIVAKYSPQGNFHWMGQRYKDYSRNVQPRYPGVITPTLKELGLAPKAKCENLMGDRKCGNFMEWGYKCSGKYAEYLKKNCYKDCGFC